MPDLNIRPFAATDADYAAAVKLANQFWPNVPSSVEIWKHRDKNRNPKFLYKRYVGEMGTGASKKVVVVGFVYEQVWSAKSGKYYIIFYIDQAFAGQGLEEPIYQYLLHSLADLNPKALKTGIKENRIDRIDFLEKKGFKQVMRSPYSELHVPDFDPNVFHKYEKQAMAAGITILNLSELRKLDSNWLEKLYHLENIIDSEIPDTDEYQAAGIDEYAKYFEDPNFSDEAWFIALDKDEYVGLSVLWPNKLLKELLTVGITGVLPSHRRRGIGMALKLRTIAFAKAYGATTIRTDNEENNPMYTLNLRLGFKPTPAWLTFEKVL